MPTFFNGKLLNVGKNEFKGQDGMQVVYFINTIAHDQGVITINSKRDFSDHLDIPSTITLTLRPDTQQPKLYKVSLSDISPLVEGDPERTVR